MGVHCQTCAHPDRERIEQELAVAKSVKAVADRWGVKRRTLSNHQQKHMRQEDIARMRLSLPDDIDVDIDALTRTGGQDAMIGLKRLGAELRETVRTAEASGGHELAVRARDLQFKIYREQMRLAAMYPGLGQVVNNNLVLADFNALATLADQILRPWPEARRAFAAGLLNLPGGQPDAIEVMALEVLS